MLLDLAENSSHEIYNKPIHLCCEGKSVNNWNTCMFVRPSAKDVKQKKLRREKKMEKIDA